MDKLSAIEAVLKTHIESTSVAVCAFGLLGSVSAYPAAQASWGGGPYSLAAGNGAVRDWDGQLNVRLVAGGEAAVRQAAEEVAALWDDATRRTELSATGVVAIAPARMDPPVVFDGSAQTVLCDVLLNVRIRYG